MLRKGSLHTKESAEQSSLGIKKHSYTKVLLNRGPDYPALENPPLHFPCRDKTFINGVFIKKNPLGRPL
jgi:hypothetical protein